MGVTNREIVNDLKFISENRSKISIQNIGLLNRKKSVISEYIFYKFLTGRICIFLLSILTLFIVFNFIHVLGSGFINDKRLVIEPVMMSDTFKEYFAGANSVITADAWDYIDVRAIFITFIFMLPLIITSLITRKHALVRLFVLSVMAREYCVFIVTIITCNDPYVSSTIIDYIKRNKVGSIILFVVLYLIFAFALIVQRSCSTAPEDTIEVKNYNSMNNKDTIAKQYLNILKKYGVSFSNIPLSDGGVSIENFPISNAAMITQMDKLYNYPLPNFTQNNIDTRTYINKSGIRTIIDKQSREVITYLNDISNPSLKMPNNIHETYLNVIKEIVSYIGDFDHDIANINNLLNPNISYSTNVLNSDNKYIYKQMELPNLCNAFKKYSGIIQKINKDYSDYKKAWQAFNNDYKITEIGESGERSILKELKFFSSDMIILQNIRLEVHDESVETDAILCSPYGIFAIETKNLGSLGSYNIVIDKDGRWRKVMKNGKWKVMGSVSKQNTRHLHGIETVINQELGGSPFIQAHSIIAFANDVVGIKNYSNNTIVRGSEIMSVVRSHERCLTQDQIKKIAEILKNHSLPPKKYPVTNWMKEIVCRNIRIRESYREMRESLKPLIDIRNMYLSPFSNQPIDYDVFDLSLEDDESEYETPEEPTNHNNNNTPHSSGGGSSFSSYNSSNSYSNSDDDEFDRAVGNCEMGNSYSYSWYDEDYNKPTWEK